MFLRFGRGPSGSVCLPTAFLWSARSFRLITAATATVVIVFVRRSRSAHRARWGSSRHVRLGERSRVLHPRVQASRGHVMLLAPRAPHSVPCSSPPTQRAGALWDAALFPGRATVVVVMPRAFSGVAATNRPAPRTPSRRTPTAPRSAAPAPGPRGTRVKPAAGRGAPGARGGGRARPWPRATRKPGPLLPGCHLMGNLNPTRNMFPRAT